MEGQLCSHQCFLNFLPSGCSHKVVALDSFEFGLFFVAWLRFCVLVLFNFKLPLFQIVQKRPDSFLFPLQTQLRFPLSRVFYLKNLIDSCLRIEFSSPSAQNIQILQSPIVPDLDLRPSRQKLPKRFAQKCAKKAKLLDSS